MPNMYWGVHFGLANSLTVAEKINLWIVCLLCDDSVRFTLSSSMDSKICYHGQHIFLPEVCNTKVEHQ